MCFHFSSQQIIFSRGYPDIMTSQRARETSPLDGEGHGMGSRPKIRGGNERLPDVAWWTVEVEEKAGRIERSDA